MSSLRRLDAELVRRHLARSREHARELIADGAVIVNGFTADKPARQVAESASVVVDEQVARWVSRGAHKLLGALEYFAAGDLVVQGRVCVDAGASTGGFTQVLLDAGASRVFAVDVGYGQLAWSLQSDPRVTVMDRVNIRHLEPAALDEQPSLIVSDLSFISLTLVIPVFTRLIAPAGDMVVMVKPQFEVGKEHVDSGVVRDPHLRAEAVWTVASAADSAGWPAVGVVASPLPGPSGNVEYFLWLRARGTGTPIGREDVARAVREGPQ